MPQPPFLDAVIIGAGPSGIGASLAFSGYRAHYVPHCVLNEQPELQTALTERAERERNGLTADGVVGPAMRKRLFS